jgi:hypothetical protein
LQHAFSSQRLLAEVVHRGSNDVDNGHDLLVGNGSVGSTTVAPRRARGTGHGAQQGLDAQQNGAAHDGGGAARDGA